MSIKVFSLFIVFPAFLIALKNIKGCVKEEVFNLKYKTELNSFTLRTLFDSGNYLGEGSYGLVHEIKWNGKPAAVKLVELPITKSYKNIQEFEIAVMSTMNGENAVVGFYGCMEAFDGLYLVQEKLYKDFDSASMLLKFKLLPFYGRLKGYIRMTEIYEKLHEKKVSHQDIKPGNIMAVDDKLKDFRIIDFGLSVKINKDVVGGTPAFNSPEKINEDGKAFASQDVYALALTIAVIETSFNAIFSKVRSKCLTSKMTNDNICYKKIPKNIQANLQITNGKSLIPILLDAIAFDPELRIQSMKTFGNKLNDLLILQKDYQQEITKIDTNEYKALIESKIKEETTQDAKVAYLASKAYLENDEFVKENKEALRPMYSKLKPQFEEIEEQEEEEIFEPIQKPEQYQAYKPKTLEQILKKMETKKAFYEPQAENTDKDTILEAKEKIKKQKEEYLQNLKKAGTNNIPDFTMNLRNRNHLINKGNNNI